MSYDDEIPESLPPSRKLASRAVKEPKPVQAFPEAVQLALIETITARLADGETLADVLHSPDMPRRWQFEAWISDHGKQDLFARARTLCADQIFDEIKTIESMVIDGVMGAGEAGVVLKSMQWRLAKMRPDRYGDRVALVGDADHPLKVENVLSDIDRAILDRFVEQKKKEETKNE